MKVAITGGHGYLGQFVTAHLVERGFDVQLLTTRAEHKNASTPVRTLNMSDSAAVATALAGQEALVHCAFSHVPGRYRGGEGDDPAGFWRTNLFMTLALLEAARVGTMRRVVLCSSRAVFDGSKVWPDGGLSDDARLEPTTHYGALKATEEHLAQVYSANSNMVVSCIRPTGIYGLVDPVADSKWFNMLAGWRQDGRLPEPRNATEVHGRDVARAIALLLTGDAKSISGQSFNCSDLITGYQEILSLAATWLGIETPALPPAPPANRLLRCDGLQELGWKPGGKAQLKRTVGDLIGAVEETPN